MKRTSKLPHWPPKLPSMTRKMHWPSVARTLLALALVVVLTALVFYHLDYYQMGTRLEQFRSGQPSPQDIYAPYTIAWVDTRETERKRNEAEEQVKTGYLFDSRVAPTALTQLQTLFQQLQRLLVAPADQTTTPDSAIPSLVVETARKLDAATLERLRSEGQDMLTRMVRDYDSYTEEEALQQLAILAKARELHPAHQLILTTLCKTALISTWAPEPHTLMEKRQQLARETIEDVVRTYQRGEIIIRQGDTLYQSDLEQLRQKQLLSPAPFQRLLPLAAIMLFAVLALGVYLRNFVRPVYEDHRKLVLLVGLILASLWGTFALGSGEKEYLVSMMAIPAAAMAIAGLLGMPTALVSTILLSVTAGLAAENQFAVTLLTMGSSLAGMMAVSAIWPARRALPAVLALIAANLTLRFSLVAILPGKGFTLAWQSLAQIGVDALAAAIGATMIAVGALYMLARPFGITTHYRLMELANPNEPLLRKMMKEAPGSYHSSVMVANIAEAAADAIGANAQLTRVAALYHDIGKLKRPGFFIENQAPLGLENMHQRLTPKLSYLILISHVKDGADMAREYKLPDEVISIVREHHGTTLAAYFYHRAVSEAGGDTIPEHEFRYPGPKPSSKESAIVMLADSVQASVKALKEPTPARIENMVHDIINSRLDDGQLEDCDMTQRDLRTVADVLVRILSGLYTYTRIEYPDIKGEGTRTRANLNSEPASAASEPTPAAPGN